jgi:large subunit ribosomal protein L1
LKWLGSAGVSPAKEFQRDAVSRASSQHHHGSSKQRCAVGDEEDMKKSGKNIEKARKAVEPRPYTLQEAVPLLQKVKFAKFDETVEVTLRLGVDPKHADQMVRGTVVLPHGLGKSKKVLVIASGEKVREAEAAGADFVGGEDMVEKITKENWTDFDALIATPDMMKSVGRLGKVLGPKGLMPNPKTGTVTMDVAKAVQEVKAGKVEFRTDKTALVHVPVGKISFTPDKLIENATTLISSVIKAKPSVAKGKYIKACYLSSSMGPGISLDTTPIEVAAKA